MVDSFFCGNEFAGTWCIQICSVLEVGQGEIKREMTWCWALYSSYTKSCKQIGEGLQKAFFSFKDIPNPIKLQGYSKESVCLCFFLAHHSFNSFPWNKFGKTLTWSLKWFIITWKGSARETLCKRSIYTWRMKKRG